MKSLLILMLFTGVVAPAHAVPSSVEARSLQEAAATRPPASELVNINTASATQLETLPGVGPATARRIIEHREKAGAFKKVEDLMNVRGIGEKAFLRLRPLVTLGGGAPRPAPTQS